jgi:hypothetical protein
VRTIKRAPSRDSILLTAFDTVALESLSSAAASAKERHSATLAKIASPSRSGNLAMITKNETMGFDSFYFEIDPLSITSQLQVVAPRVHWVDAIRHGGKAR